MNKKIVFLDIETTGRPEKKPGCWNRYYHPKDIEKYENSRVVQIAILVYENGEEKKVHNYIRKPENFLIKNKSYFNSILLHYIGY